MNLRGAEVKDILQIAVFSMAIMSGAFMVWAKIQEVPALAAKVDNHESRLNGIEAQIKFLVRGMEKLTKDKFEGDE
jgi:hypothetical protein